MTIKHFSIASEAEMVAFGRLLAREVGNHPKGDVCLVYLSGPLGAGKTTLVRGVLQGLGHEGAVKSPTYTLVEPYDLPAGHCCHFDLYRLSEPEELEALGIRDYLATAALVLLEWPQRGGDFLPAADLQIDIEYAAGNGGRSLTVTAPGEYGEMLLNRL